MPLPVFVFFIPGFAIVLLIQVIICHVYQFRITYTRTRPNKKAIKAGPRSGHSPNTARTKYIGNQGPSTDPHKEDTEPLEAETESSKTADTELRKTDTKPMKAGKESPRRDKKPCKPNTKSRKKEAQPLSEDPVRPGGSVEVTVYDAVCDATQAFANLARSACPYDENRLSDPQVTSSSHGEDRDYLNPKSYRGKRRKSVFAESYNPADDDDDEVNTAVHSKTEEERDWLKATVKELLLFQHLATDQVDTVVDAMYKYPAAAGDYICRQDERGNQFFVVQKGVYDVFLRPEDDGDETLVMTYDNEGSFGELALLYNQPRAASVVARTEGMLWAVDGDTFRRIVYKITYQKRQMYESLIDNVPMLHQLDLYERANLVDALVPKSYEDGELVFQQGDHGDGMYFIVSGGARIVMTGRLVQQLTIGSYFGELALVTDKPRAASAYAVDSTSLAFLDRAAFERLLGPCMNIFRRNIVHYNEQLAQIIADETSAKRVA